MRSNDRGPDLDDPLEGFWNELYEKFGWLEDLKDTESESWPFGLVDKVQSELESMIEFVRETSHKQGSEDALAGITREDASYRSRLEDALFAVRARDRLPYHTRNLNLGPIGSDND